MFLNCKALASFEKYKNATDNVFCTNLYMAVIILHLFMNLVHI